MLSILFLEWTQFRKNAKVKVSSESWIQFSVLLCGNGPGYVKENNIIVFHNIQIIPGPLNVTIFPRRLCSQLQPTHPDPELLCGQLHHDGGRVEAAEAGPAPRPGLNTLEEGSRGGDRGTYLPSRADGGSQGIFSNKNLYIYLSMLLGKIWRKRENKEN